MLNLSNIINPKIQLILICIIDLIFSISNDKKEKNYHRSRYIRNKSFMRNLFEYRDWNYNESIIYSNKITPKIQSYYITDGEQPFITYEKDSKNYIQKGELLFEINFKKILEIIEIMINQDIGKYYVCFEDSKRLYQLDPSSKDGNNIFRDVYGDSNFKETTRITCKKSYKNQKLLFGYIGYNLIQSYDSSTNGIYKIVEESNAVFLDINFIYPNQDDYVNIFIIQLKDSVYQILQVNGNSQKYDRIYSNIDTKFIPFIIKESVFISRTIDKKFYIILSFNENSVDSANVYFHSTKVGVGDVIVKYSFNLNLVLPDVKFKIIKFIKITEFISFKAEIDGNIYVGVINLYVRKLFFLKKFDNFENIIFTNDYKTFPNYDMFNNNANLLIMQNSEVKYLDCPFTSEFGNDNKKICTISCSNIKFGIQIDPINGNTCKDCSEKYYEQGYCVDKCSNNAVLLKDSKTCVICMNEEKNVFIQTDEITNTNICVEKCSENMAVNRDTFKCYSCKLREKYFLDGECVDKMPERAECDSESVCKICEKTINTKYFYKDLENDLNSRCLADCEDYMIKSSVPLTCEICLNGYYKIKNECIKSCPSYGEIKDPLRKTCKTCEKETFKYLYKGNCIESCPNEYFPDIYNICYKCSEIDLQYMTVHDKKCLSKCPVGSQIDEKQKYCNVCKESKKFLSLNKVCEDTCGKYELFDEFNQCISCKQNGNFFFNGGCVKNCPYYAEVNNDNGVCFSCKDKGMFLLNSRCSIGCSELMIYNSDNVCSYCKFNEFFYKNKCYDKCPDNLRRDTTTSNFLCEDCKISNKVYNPITNKCEEKCPDDMLFDYQGVCYFCKDKNSFFFEKQCLEDCPLYTEKDSINFKCNYCAADKFVEYRKCVDKCSIFHIYETKDNIKICKKCQDYEKTTSDNICLSKCPAGYKYDKTTEHCEQCSKSNKVLFKYTQCISIEECSSDKYFFDRGNNTCVDCFEENKYFFHGKCLDDCDTLLYAKNDTSKTCTNCSLLQKEKLLDLYASICIEKCKDNQELRGNKCIECKNENKYLLEGKCQGDCGDFYLKDSLKNICLSCSPEIYFPEEKKCVKNCEYKQINGLSGLKKCVYFNECQKENKFLMKYYNKTQTCLSECPKSYEQKNGECISCKSQGKFFKNNECINNCGRKFIVNETDSICYSCDNSIYKGQCINSCHNYHLIRNEATYICEKCQNDQYYFDYKCYDICPENTTTDRGDMRCIEETKLVPNCFNIDSNYINKNEYCSCRENFLGKLCNVEINSQNKYFQVLGDDKDQEYYNFWINFPNGSKNFNFSIIDIIWSFNKTEIPKYRNFHNIRVSKYDFNSYPYKFEIKAIINTNNQLNKSISSYLNFEKKESDKLDKCLKLDYNNFEMNADSNNSDEYLKNLIYKIEVNLNDSLCETMKTEKEMEETYNGLNLKYFLIDLDNRKIQLTKFLRKKKLVLFLPDFKFILLEVSTNTGNLYKLKIPKKNNTNINDNIDYSQIPKITKIIKEIKDINLQINVINNFMKKFKFDNENFQDISNLVNDCLNKSFENLKKGFILDKRSIFGLMDRYVFSLSSYENKPIVIDQYLLLNDFLYDFSDNLNEGNTKINLKREDFPYVINSVDNVIEQLNINNQTPSTQLSSDKDISRRNVKNFDKVQEMLKNFMKNLSIKLQSGEKISIEMDNIVTRIDRLNEDQNNLFFNHPEFKKKNNDKNKMLLRNLEEISDGELDEKLKYNQKQQDCDFTNVSLCSTKDDFKFFFQYLNITNRAKPSDIAFISNIVSNNLLENQNAKLQNNVTLNFFAFDTNSKKTIKTKKNFKTSIAIYGKNYSDGEVNQTVCVSRLEFDIISQDKENKGNYKFNECKSYFNKTLQVTVCQCLSDTEVFSIYNLAILKFQVLYQYNTVVFSFVNPLSVSIIGGSISLIIIISILLTMMDITQDNRLIANNYKDDHEILKTVFVDLHGLYNANHFNFSFYATMYDYPIFKIINTYQYDQPRVFRFTYEIMIIILNLALSIINEFFRKNNPSDIIKDRNIKDIFVDVNNMRALLSYIIFTLLNVAVSKVIIFTISNTFSSLLYFDSLGESIWLKRENMIELYVKKYITKPVSSKQKMNQIFERLIAIKKICGPVLVSNTPNFNPKKYSKSSILDLKLGFRNDNLMAKYYDLNINNKKKDNLVIDNKNKILLCARQTDFLIDGMNHKSEEEIREKLKLDDIRYNLFLEIKFNSEIFKDFFKYDYDKMKIVSQTRLKVIADYKKFPNKIIDELKRQNKMKIIYSILSIILLLGVFVGIIYSLLYLISIAFEINKFRIIKTWLIPSLISLILGNFVINFIINYVRAIFLFKLEGSNNKIIKFLSKYIITQESRYMYKIRNFLTKYYKRLDFEEK